MAKSDKNFRVKFRVKLRSRRIQLRGRRSVRRPFQPCPAPTRATERLTDRVRWPTPTVPTAPLDTTARAWYPRHHHHGVSQHTYRQRCVSKVPSYAYRTCLNFGNSGLMSLVYTKLSRSCLNAMVQAIRRELARRASLHVRVAADRPVTARPAESRMGKGKGGLSYWEAAPKPGTVLFETCDTRYDPRRLQAALLKVSSLHLKCLR